MSFPTLIFAPDRMLCQPLTAWQQHMLANWLRAVERRQQGLLPTIDLAPAFNQLGLIATFQGQAELAEHLCESQMLYWYRLSGEFARPDLLSHIIQPYINLARLARWQGRLEQASGLYRSLAPDASGQLNSTLQALGIAYSLDELANSDPTAQGLQSLMNLVYWSEYGRLLLQTADEASVLDHVQQGLSANSSSHLRRCLLEVGLLTQCQHGRKPMKLLGTLTSKLDFSARLPFLMIHLQLAAMHQLPEQGQVFDQIWQLLNAETIDWRRSNLLAMYDAIGKILLRLGYTEQAMQMATRQREWAQLIDDEMLAFAATARLVETGALAKDALSAFDNSLYVQIRKARGLDVLDHDPLAADIELALQEFDQGEWQACAQRLRCFIIPQELMKMAV